MDIVIIDVGWWSMCRYVDCTVNLHLRAEWQPGTCVRDLPKTGGRNTCFLRGKKVKVSIEENSQGHKGHLYFFYTHSTSVFITIYIEHIFNFSDL